MDWRAILREAQVAEAAVVAEERGEFLPALAEGFRGLAVGEDDGFGLGGHREDEAVVVGADGVVDFEEAVLVGRAVGVDVADELTAVTPRAGELARLAEGGVGVVEAGDAGVHQQPENERLRGVPDFAELVAIALAVGEARGDGGIGRPSGADFAAGVVGGGGWFHAMALGSDRRGLFYRRGSLAPWLAFVSPMLVAIP